MGVLIIMKTWILLISLATFAQEISAKIDKLENQRPIVPTTVWRDFCKDGLPDGTDCHLLCRHRMCSPPFTQCYKGECRRLGYEGQCLFKDDGAYCYKRELCSTHWWGNGVQVSVPIGDAKKRSQLRWSSVWASATVQLVDCPARMKIVFLPIQSATRTNVI